VSQRILLKCCYLVSRMAKNETSIPYTDPVISSDRRKRETRLRHRQSEPYRFGIQTLASDAHPSRNMIAVHSLTLSFPTLMAIITSNLGLDFAFNEVMVYGMNRATPWASTSQRTLALVVILSRPQVSTFVSAIGCKNT
jgi:hypothetical protein